jgi:uncharacterized protein YndB with AHSA1/START domain
MTDVEASRVLVALRVPVPAERAFSAFTEEIGTWWQPHGLFQFTDRSGTLAFEPGPDGRLVETYADGSSFVVGEIRAWEPPHRLVVSWRHANFPADQETELHVRFDEVEDPAGGAGAVAVETRVVVEHFGWDRIPPEHAARHGFPLPLFQLRFAEWWRSLLGSLADLTDAAR